ncbi:MAG TPA: 5'/3'-nucleotidase SurE, partial [Symbiobacteriaceae bacterium]|nr:5'/3'-nucleotidase SurE [Symbiobacteriaceae bacterium]
MRPLFLVTNDDGIESAGLWALAEGLTAVGDVVICAPDRDYSGAGAATRREDGINGPVSVDTIDPERYLGFKGRLPHSGSLKAYALAAPPAACAWLGMESLLGRRPDLIVSGINKGPNMGADTVISGTVGAVRLAQSLGVSGLAVSTTYDEPDWRAASEAAVAMAQVLVRTPLLEPLALNLNVPSGGSLGPIKVTKLGQFSWLAFSRFCLKRTGDALTIVQHLDQPVFKGAPGTDSG